MLIVSHQCADDLSAFTLGAIGAEEAQRVAAHISVCHICHAKTRSYLTIVSLLLVAAPPCDPPSAIKQCLLRQMNNECDTALVRDP